MLYINTQKQLEDVCKELQQESVLGIDTEFMNYSKHNTLLCLIQISTPTQQFIIDILSKLEFKPLLDLLADPNVVKIFHSIKQDLKILYNRFQQVPCNVFDTQVAAEYCQLSKNPISYSNLCYQLLGIELDKRHQRSNWKKRPLTDSMMLYASYDVKYLHPVYLLLKQNLYENGSLAEYQKTMQDILNENNYRTRIQQSWKRIKFNHNCPNLLNCMQLLASYREEQAIKYNIPSSTFATDRELKKICNVLPTTTEEFAKLSFKSHYLKTEQHITKICKICNKIKKNYITKITNEEMA